jgi:hypothetical protein
MNKRTNISRSGLFEGQDSLSVTCGIPQRNRIPNGEPTKRSYRFGIKPNERPNQHTESEIIFVILREQKKVVEDLIDIQAGLILGNAILK